MVFELFPSSFKLKLQFHGNFSRDPRIRALQLRTQALNRTYYGPWFSSISSHPFLKEERLLNCYLMDCARLLQQNRSAGFVQTSRKHLHKDWILGGREGRSVLIDKQDLTCIYRGTISQIAFEEDCLRAPGLNDKRNKKEGFIPATSDKFQSLDLSRNQCLLQQRKGPNQEF